VRRQPFNSILISNLACNSETEGGKREEPGSRSKIKNVLCPNGNNGVGMWSHEVARVLIYRHLQSAISRSRRLSLPMLKRVMCVCGVGKEVAHDVRIALARHLPCRSQLSLPQESDRSQRLIRNGGEGGRAKSFLYAIL
jgi:hypothetical protein